ncbi:hypothetical protein CKAN_00232000 [Cinnamomum micranthum f. kanehirae]|uniref:Uncharacterized protein n=1 Tax=Cinnamomum micranthum f. kanehirae TaxID=337451 RepID=A0A443N658_9MAGN|nr:hypothetical protein CKAN_00232000 [Cinnamomum micranthum f. kanehirae]
MCQTQYPWFNRFLILDQWNKISTVTTLDIIQMKLGVPEDTAVWSKTFKELVPASVWRWMKKAFENIHQEKNPRLLEFVASQIWRS